LTAPCRQGNAALDALARTWVSAYKAASAPRGQGSGGAPASNRALGDLVNLVFCASGATENIVRAEEDVADLDEEGKEEKEKTNPRSSNLLFLWPTP
jgi:hypothetical protein